VYCYPKKRQYSDFSKLGNKQTATKQMIKYVVAAGLVIELARALHAMQKSILTGITKEL
jgi:hypothetical protein